MSLTKLHVVTSLFNPWRYSARGFHYDRFRQHVRHSHMCQLHAGELAFGRRDFEFTQGHLMPVDQGETMEYRFRTSTELWHKERLLNRLVQYLPHDWEYVAWIDADINFVRDDWAAETVHRLQHYDVVQMFSHCQNLDSNFTVLGNQAPKYGFVYAWENGLKPIGHQYYGAFQHGHPGFAWAFRREAYEKLGGFMDTAVLGSGDFHMALSLTCQYDWKRYSHISPGYKKMLDVWNARCQEYIKCNVGHVPGLVNHYYHGAAKDRRYNDRWKIIEKHGFDPEDDLKHDAQGLYTWTSRCPQLAYDIRNYFATRREDHPSD